MKISFCSIYATLFLFFYSTVLGLGLIGYGIDVQTNYLPGKITSFNLLDTVGAQLSILRVDSLYLGVGITTFILVSSITLFFSSYLSLPILKTSLYLLPFFLSWPVILPSLNALRQGICSAFFIYLLYYYCKETTRKPGNILTCIFLLLLTCFSHKLGIILVLCFCLTLLYYNLEKIKAPNLIIILLELICFFSGLLFLLSARFSDYESHTIGLDLRFLALPLLLWSSFSSLKTFNTRYTNPTFSISFFLSLLYLFALSFAFFGFTYQVERIIMFSIIPLTAQFLRALNLSISQTQLALLFAGLLCLSVTLLGTPIFYNLQLEYT